LSQGTAVDEFFVLGGLADLNALQDRNGHCDRHFRSMVRKKLHDKILGPVAFPTLIHPNFNIGFEQQQRRPWLHSYSWIDPDDRRYNWQLCHYKSFDLNRA